jgi:hypothetical protein
MRESSSVIYLATAIRTPPASGAEPARRPPASGAVGSARPALRRASDQDRIAEGPDDAVVRRLFAAGLDLEAVLGLIGDHRAFGKICLAIDELDAAIRDIRDAVLGSRPG